jgi:hypothetical protein
MQRGCLHQPRRSPHLWKDPDTFRPENAPDQPPEAEEYEAGQAQPCGARDNATSGVCISPVGHRGRHKYRTLTGVDVRAEGLN